MGYRIIEVTDDKIPAVSWSGWSGQRDEHSRSWLDGAREIATHDSAYEAMRVMRAEFDRILDTPAAPGPSSPGSPGSMTTRPRLPNWYLVDSMGQVIASPYDVREAQLA